MVFRLFTQRGNTFTHGGERKPAKENARRKQRGQQRLITLDRSRLLLKRHLTQSALAVKRIQAVFVPKWGVYVVGTTLITGIFDISLRTCIPMNEDERLNLFYLLAWIDVN